MSPATVPLTVTATEAAAFFDLYPETLGLWARQGRVEAAKVDGTWLFDGPSVAAYVARSHRFGRNRGAVPAAPLLRQIELAGGDYALGVRESSREARALWRARRTGWLTERQADRLAVKLLGLTLWEIAG